MSNLLIISPLFFIISIALTTDSTVNSSPTFSPTTASSTLADLSCLHTNNWYLNKNAHYNTYFSSKTDVKVSAAYGLNKWKITYTGIMNYDRVFTAADITALNSRSSASSDFTTGKTTAVAGNKYVWGANIGYSSAGCKGYWPPGPVCPTASNSTMSFPLNPKKEIQSNGCYAGTGPAGVWVNGALIFGTSDASSYNSKGYWYNNAPVFEYYAMDICNGHAANGQYHHHHYPKCIGEILNDTGNSHSKIWGWVIDGIPIYGPYQKKNTLAVPCWQKRDYSSSITGCTSGNRTCQLLDQFNYTKGTTKLSSSNYGPAFTATSGPITLSNGAYFEDYFYNSSCHAQGGQYLDAYNGHSHGSYGYHYHLTIDSSANALFPYTFGPKYYGCRAGGACCTHPGQSDCTVASTCDSASLAKPLASQLCVNGTLSPTVAPTKAPVSVSPTVTSAPTNAPVTSSPTVAPVTSAPTNAPVSSAPTISPTSAPTNSPVSSAPTTTPTTAPTKSPSTGSPTLSPVTGSASLSFGISVSLLVGTLVSSIIVMI